MLDKLAAECRRISLTFSDGKFTNGCDEFGDLKKKIEAAGEKSGY